MGDYRVQVGREVTRAIALGLHLGVIQLDALLSQLMCGGSNADMGRPLGAVDVFLQPNARHKQNIMTTSNSGNTVECKPSTSQASIAWKDPHCPLPRALRRCNEACQLPIAFCSVAVY